MDFTLTDEQKNLVQMVRDFVAKEIEPYTHAWDRQKEYPLNELRKKYADLGLLGLSLPEQYGGEGLTVFEVVLVLEEIAKVSPVAALPVFEANVGPIKVVELFGTPEQKQKYIPPVCQGECSIAVGMTEPDAGSALTDLKTSATLEGEHYLVNGQKQYITGGGHSEAYLVYVRMSPEPGAKGIGGLIIEDGTPGLTYGKQEEFMGLNGMPSCSLFFENCKVPKENLVARAGEFTTLMTAFDIERLGNTTMSLGIAQGALEQSIRYSRERKQFGKEICEFQAVQLMLAEMSMKVEAARLLLHRAASSAGKSYPSVLESSLAKCYANQIAKEVSDMAVQIHGGFGYSKEGAIERMLRDSHGWAIAGGTIQMQKINIAASLIGKRFNQRR